MTNFRTITGSACIGIFVLSACSIATKTGKINDNSLSIQTSKTMKKNGDNWVNLFDGKSLDGWHAFNKSGVVKNWTIDDGALVCLGAAIGDTGGDIVTDSEYENFEFSWDWKIDKGGNSGVMYHVVESPRYKAPWETGPEYQMIDDDGYVDKLEDWQKTGVDYAMNLTNDKKKVMPVGEWNSSKILYNEGHVEHWLNGEMVVEFQAGDEKWLKNKTEGKWKDYPDYGSVKKGRIALQDHGQKAFFKNIKIKEL